MKNKGIPETPLFDPISLEMDYPLFEVTNVFYKNLSGLEYLSKSKNLSTIFDPSAFSGRC